LSCCLIVHIMMSFLNSLLSCCLIVHIMMTFLNNLLSCCLIVHIMISFLNSLLSRCLIVHIMMSFLNSLLSCCLIIHIMMSFLNSLLSCCLIVHIMMSFQYIFYCIPYLLKYRWHYKSLSSENLSKTTWTKFFDSSSKTLERISCKKFSWLQITSQIMNAIIFSECVLCFAILRWNGKEGDQETGC
jgi:hypothetical protein